MSEEQDAIVEQAIAVTAEPVDFKPAPVNPRLEARRAEEGRPPLPTSMKVRPHIARSNQTFEQLGEEQAWFQWMVDNLTEEPAVDFAKRELADIRVEIDGRPVPE